VKFKNVFGPRAQLPVCDCVKRQSFTRTASLPYERTEKLSSG